MKCHALNCILLLPIWNLQNCSSSGTITRFEEGANELMTMLRHDVCPTQTRASLKCSTIVMQMFKETNWVIE